METQTSTAIDRPDIYMTSTECNTLSALALSVEQKHPVSAALLLAELDRAVISDADSLPDQTVVMNSQLEFVDESNGTARSIKLVYPHEADIDAGRISILTPIGAGLIGMSAGHSIRWPDREGQYRLLRIVSVTPPAQS